MLIKIFSHNATKSRNIILYFIGTCTMTYNKTPKIQK